MKFVHTVVACVVLLGVSTLQGASGVVPKPVCEAGTFEENADVAGDVAEFLTMRDLQNMALVNRSWNPEIQRQMAKLKQWMENGGLLVARFGEPSDKDHENMRRYEDSMLRFNSNGTPLAVGDWTFDNWKLVLTGFVQIDQDEDAAERCRSNAWSYIQGRQDFSAGQKDLLRSLLGGEIARIEDIDDDGMASFAIAVTLGGDDGAGARESLTPEDKRRLLPRIIHLSAGVFGAIDRAGFPLVSIELVERLRDEVAGSHLPADQPKWFRPLMIEAYNAMLSSKSPPFDLRSLVKIMKPAFALGRYDLMARGYVWWLSGVVRYPVFFVRDTIDLGVYLGLTVPYEKLRGVYREWKFRRSCGTLEELKEVLRKC